ncbi:hypothetical protein DV736_g2635, partial [Chaetothyriales sp. CBS 134916]
MSVEGDDDELDSQTTSRAPWYGEDDNSATTDRELKGWYCYGIAAEVFAVTGAGSFLPVTIEQLARENGVFYSDRSTPCVGATTDSARRLMARATNTDNDQCIVKLLGSEMTTASFAMYTVSVAVFIQALALVSFSSLADYGNNRKRLLIVFAMTGAITGMCFILIAPSLYLIAALLAVLAITCLGCSFVMLNSFLPVIAANHPLVKTFSPQRDTSVSAPAPTLTATASHPQSSTSPALQLSNKISARGVGLGYAAAVLVQLCSILILFLASKVITDRTIPLRIVLFVAGLWWFIFSIPTAFWLRNRPGPPLPSSFSKQKYASSRLRLASSYITFAWSSVYGTLKLALSLSQVRLFLLAWFLLSDATTTVGSTAILFARTELGLTPVGIACLSITATCSGICGAVLWPIISRRLGWNTGRTIMACLCLMEIIPLYGLLSLIPGVRRLGWLGLQQYWEIFPLAVIHGVAMGGLSSYCRSLFGQLIPPSHEASFYALFAITDKGSSAVGPAVVGRIVDITGSIRPSFWFLLVLVGLPIIIVGRVNEVRGRHEAVRASVVDDDTGIELSASPGEGRDREQREGLMERH